MSFSEECQKHFGTTDLYKILGIRKTASESQVKKGYHKVSLKVHPDRASEDNKQASTEKFQTLGKVYCILTDTEKRKIYDETGEVPEDGDFLPPDRDWKDYWRILFPKVTKGDIEEFEKKYKGSDEELADLKDAYLNFEGNMDEILSNVMCADIEDEQRFTSIIRGWIKSKEVPSYAAFSKEKKASKDNRKRKAKKEAEEAESLKEELGMTGDDSLMALIQSRQQSRGSQSDSFFDQLEAKYAQPKKAKAGSSKTSKGKKAGKK